jgi:hypothetical protein
MRARCFIVLLISASLTALTASSGCHTECGGVFSDEVELPGCGCVAIADRPHIEDAISRGDGDCRNGHYESFPPKPAPQATAPESTRDAATDAQDAADRDADSPDTSR